MTPGIICSRHGRLPLTEAQYVFMAERTLKAYIETDQLWHTWQCPQCNRKAEFDPERWNGKHLTLAEAAEDEVVRKAWSK